MGKEFRAKKKSDINLHLIACWPQKAANWLDTFRGWIHSQKQIFSFKEDIFHLHLFHGFRPKSIWYEENLIWLFIQIILPALIATLLPRGNRGQRDPGSQALKALDWGRVGVQWEQNTLMGQTYFWCRKEQSSVEKRQSCKCTRTIAYLTKFYSHHQYIL